MKKFLICLFSFIFISCVPLCLSGCNSECLDLKNAIESMEQSIKNLEESTKSVNLTVNYNNNTDENDVLAIKKGSVIDFSNVVPTNSPSPYLVFDYWCSDSALTQAVDFSESIVSDTTIYAKWKLSENYIVTQVLGGSMSASGINTNDYVLIEKVQDRDLLKVDDIILFYAYYPEDEIPTIEDALENNALPVLHQIVNVIENSGVEYYETKGSSSSINDSSPVCRTLVVGRFLQVVEIEQYLPFIGTY